MAERVYGDAVLPSLQDAKSMDTAIEALTDAAWIKPAGSRDGGGIGRKSGDYEVNPAVHIIKDR